MPKMEFKFFEMDIRVENMHQFMKWDPARLKCSFCFFSAATIPSLWTRWPRGWSRSSVSTTPRWSTGNTSKSSSTSSDSTQREHHSFSQELNNWKNCKSVFFLTSKYSSLAVLYFNQLLGAATRKLVEILFWHFSTLFGDFRLFSVIFHLNH